MSEQKAPHQDISVPFFRPANVAAVMGAELRNPPELPCLLSQTFRTHSGDVSPGDVFVALPGENLDGASFIGDAVARGAGAVIVGRHKEEFWQHCCSDIPLFLVEDAESATSQLAAAWMGLLRAKSVAITGSVGKTSTREFLSGILSRSMKVHSAIKSYNTIIGCSLTILSAPATTEVLVLEMGASHEGDIRALVKSFPPSMGVITEIAPAHLAGFGSLAGVLRAKMEITEAPTLEVMSYNADNDLLSAAISAWAAESKGQRRTIGVGTKPSDVTISELSQSVSSKGEPCLSFSLLLRGGKHRCRAAVFGKQHARNMGYAVALACELGVEPKDACAAVDTLESVGGRGRIIPSQGGGLIVDESYNSNPGSTYCALNNVLETSFEGDRRRIAILGGMRELGVESNSLHEGVLAGAAPFDEVYLIGSEWGQSCAAHPAVKGVFGTTEEMAERADIGSLGDAVVLLKGSRHYALEKLLPLITGAAR